MVHAAVIFDVDGPLLDLTAAEEDVFFEPLKRRLGVAAFSRDWDSYRVRNDREIYREILETHTDEPVSEADLDAVTADYISLLAKAYDAGDATVEAIPGARTLVERLAAHDGLALGLATANLVAAAELRLRQAGMWEMLRHHPGGADFGGPKSNILRQVIAGLGLGRGAIVFIGDNLNDLEAAEENGVHFIGFHVDEPRRRRLQDAGAHTVSGDHETTWRLIRERLDVTPD